MDDDVAAALERLKKAREASLKELINEALRRGLRDMSAKPKRRGTFRTKAVILGPTRINLDHIAEALAVSEGEAFR
ncbi:MAG: hypothetical protein JO021_22150 [Alphaproteobacteria bacterium]|nr:hypothetical protein [Alphaproteobacteria bacterium]